MAAAVGEAWWQEAVTTGGNCAGLAPIDRVDDFRASRRGTGAGVAAGERLRPLLAPARAAGGLHTPAYAQAKCKWLEIRVDGRRRAVLLQNPGSHDCCFRHGFSIVHYAV